MSTKQDDHNAGQAAGAKADFIDVCLLDLNLFASDEYKDGFMHSYGQQWDNWAKGNIKSSDSNGTKSDSTYDYSDYGSSYPTGDSNSGFTFLTIFAVIGLGLLGILIFADAHSFFERKTFSRPSEMRVPQTNFASRNRDETFLSVKKETDSISDNYTTGIPMDETSSDSSTEQSSDTEESVVGNENQSLEDQNQLNGSQEFFDEIQNISDSVVSSSTDEDTEDTSDEDLGNFDYAETEVQATSSATQNQILVFQTTSTTTITIEITESVNDQNVLEDEESEDGQ